jgi:hypothetical protein
MSVLLHWLASQSIFLAIVKVRWNSTYSPDPSSFVYNPIDPVTGFVTAIRTVGFSAIAIIFFTITAAVFFAGILILSFRRYDAGIPVVGSNSRGIARACNIVEGPEAQTELYPIRWGERVFENNDDHGDADAINQIPERTITRRLAFSRYEVAMPQEGVYYD